MSANQRLQGVQAALNARGAQDIKFCFAPGTVGIPRSEVTADVAAFMEAFLSGKGAPMKDFGDPPPATA